MPEMMIDDEKLLEGGSTTPWTDEEARQLDSITRNPVAERIAELHAELDRKLEPQIERIKQEIAARIEAADDVEAAVYETSTAIANVRQEIFWPSDL